jgi:hypothetical protein
MKKVLCVLLLIIPIMFYGKTVGKSVLVLPVINEAGLSHDYIPSLMQMYLTRYFGMVKGYSAQQLHPYDLNTFNIPEDTLIDTTQVVKVGRGKQSRYVVQVVFVEDEKVPDKLIFTFRVYDVKEKRLFFTYKDVAEGDITILQTLEQISISAVENVTGIELVFGTLQVDTDKLCHVSIDGGELVETPYKDNRILTGMHQITIIHNNVVVFNESREVLEDKTTEIDIPVFVPLSITADKECEVQIDGRIVGRTPYIEDVLSGQEYSIKMMYYDVSADMNPIVLDKQISTVLCEPVTVHVPATGSIHLTGTTSDLWGTVYEKKGYMELPYSFSHLFAGTYRVSAYLNDTKWKTRHVLYNEKVHLESGTTLEIPVDTWKPLWGLTAIPAASQFHNRKFVKAGIILGGFLTSLIPIGVGAGLYAYQRLIEYPVFLSELNRLIVDEPNNIAARDALTLSYNTKYYAYTGLWIGGLVLNLCFWIWSIIDGVITTKRTHKLFISNKKAKINFSMVIK